MPSVGRVHGFRFRSTTWRRGFETRRRGVRSRWKRLNVNYVYELGERANKELQQLPSWLGEEILDELEILVHSPLPAGFKSPAGAVLDFIRQHGNEVFYVFLTFPPIQTGSFSG